MPERSFAAHDERTELVDVYMYASADTPSHAASKNFLNITELYRRGFLNKDATVWMNADAPEAGIWVLTHRSSYIRIHETVRAGWYRVTRTNARWARTLNATARDGDTVLDIRDVPTDVSAGATATIIAMHRETGTHIGVVADGSVQRPDRYGQFKFDPFTVVDLHHYTPPENTAPSAFEAAHAMLNGAAILSCTSSDGGEFIRSNMDVFKVDFGEKHLEFLDLQWGKVEEYAKIQTDMLVQRVKELGMSGAWGEGLL